MGHPLEEDEANVTKNDASQCGANRTRAGLAVLTMLAAGLAAYLLTTAGARPQRAEPAPAAGLDPTLYYDPREWYAANRDPDPADCYKPQQHSAPLNILFIMADDLGWGDLGCYGHPYVRTPNIDRLAAEGVRFTQFHVSSPVCSPTRTACLTGLFPARVDIHSHLHKPEWNRRCGQPDCLDPDVPTLADLLKETGYTTGIFGKWHLGGAGCPAPGEYGFDAHLTSASSGPSFRKEEHARARRLDAERIAAHAIDFMDHAAANGNPFYLSVCFTDPHAPLDPPARYVEMYRTIAGPEGNLSSFNKYLSPAAVYCAAITHMDAQVGRMLDRLEELGLQENTLVIFTSDNGPEDISVSSASYSGVGSPGPYRGRKRSLYEGGICVPLVARWPGKIWRNTLNDSTVMGDVDLLPTVCYFAGVPEQRLSRLRLDGQNMACAFFGRPLNRARPLMWEYNGGGIGHPINQSPPMAIRENEWKLLMDYPGQGTRIELYNLAQDVREVDNVATDFPGVARRLSEQLRSWCESLPGCGPLDLHASATVADGAR